MKNKIIIFMLFMIIGITNVKASFILENNFHPSNSTITAQMWTYPNYTSLFNGQCDYTSGGSTYASCRFFNYLDWEIRSIKYSATGINVFSSTKYYLVNFHNYSFLSSAPQKVYLDYCGVTYEGNIYNNNGYWYSFTIKGCLENSSSLTLNIDYANNTKILSSDNFNFVTDFYYEEDGNGPVYDIENSLGDMQNDLEDKINQSQQETNEKIEDMQESINGTINDNFNSCKEPENIFDGTFNQGTINSNGNFQNSTNQIYTSQFIKVDPNTTYIYSNAQNIPINNIVLYDNNKNFIERVGINSFSYTTNSNTYYIKFTHYNATGITPNNITNAIFKQDVEFVCTNKMDETNNRLDETNQQLSEQNKTSKGILGKLGDLFTSVVELPLKLVNLLVDALKSLFVPTDNQLYEIIQDSKNLSENFGFVGESINFFINIFTSFLGLVNNNGCIELPAFVIGQTSLFDSITFWETQNVCLSDNVILSSNIDTIRVITSIAMVCLFINFAAKKFFTILSKNESQNDQAQEILDRYK